MRVAVNGAITLWLGFHFRHHFHGPPVDYVGLAAASVASWVGVPGPGESVLIAAGIFAAKHRLDIAEVLLVAWVAATAGGIAGWLIGMRAGRAVMTAPGPFHRARLHAVARGEEIFGRVPVLAVVLTPSWVAGIHRVRARVFLTTNTLSAAVWAIGIGLGAYFAGPAVIEVVDDIGWVATIGFVVLVAAGVLIEMRRRRLRRGRAGGHPGSELGARPGDGLEGH
jgi:membrane protein DedA with SNARE-associated domain